MRKAPTKERQRLRALITFLVTLAITFLLTNQTVLISRALTSSYQDVMENELPVFETQEIAMFYNLYISPEGPEEAFEVVEEQISQIGGSFVNSRGFNTTVYYNTIGDANAINTTYMDELCTARNNLRCTHLNHFVKAYEEVTLQSLYDFCQMNENTKVVYFHSKGSYHSSENNANWRRRMLSAVTNRSCVEPPDNSCNLCGLQFFPTWTFLFPGNFWTADCSYVKELVPPSSFLEDTVQVVTETRKMENLQLFDDKSLWLYTDWTQGTRRYAPEHWIGSHPSVVPCDMSKTNDVLDWYRAVRNSSDFEFALAPRHSIDDDWWQRRNGIFRNNVALNQTRRMRERFLLPGLMLKWITIYNSTPPDSSWVWSWYPDGDTWRQGFKDYGSDVVRALTSAALNRTFVSSSSPTISLRVPKTTTYRKRSTKVHHVPKTAAKVSSR